MSIKFEVVVKTIAEREELIEKRIAATKDTDSLYDFRGPKVKQLPVIELDIKLPIYRMENCRTFVDQKAYIQNEKKAQDYFSKGQENLSVQQTQHNILVGLAKKSLEGSVASISKVLENEGQRENILLTHDGVVINGNRRLAAMRELYADKPSKHSSHISCSILPKDTTPEEIIDIESRLQGRLETKLDYDWIGECVLINRQIATGKTPAQVALIQNRKESEIKNMVQAFTEANLYLNEWKKEEGNYATVVDAEQLFADLAKSILKHKNPKQARAARLIAWNILDNSSKLSGRLYRYNTLFDKKAFDVVAKMNANFNLKQEVNDENTDEGEDFAVDIDSNDDSEAYDSLKEALIKSKSDKNTSDQLVDIFNTVLEEEKGQKDGEVSLKAANASHAKLSEVEISLSRADPSSYSIIHKQLDSIITKANSLKTIVDKYLSSSKTS